MSPKIYQAAAARAAEERKRLGLGSEPVMDMKSLVEGQGVFVYSTPVPDGSLSGCFALINGDPWMLVNTAQTVGRQRFTIAHEYCHSLVDRELEFVVCTGEKPRHEKFADAFAAAFLMPADATLAFFTPDSGRAVSAEWVVDFCYAFGVSYQAAVFRLGSLKVIAPKEQRALFGESPMRVAGAMGYDVRDPASPFHAGDPECEASMDAFPKAYRSAALAAFEQGLISESKLAESLGVDADDLDDLLDPIEAADVPVAW
jgi:Zn-dependent peptidase ImmA (M78 family)